VYRGPAGSHVVSIHPSRLAPRRALDQQRNVPLSLVAGVSRPPPGRVPGLDTPASASASSGTRPAMERAAFFGGRCIEAGPDRAPGLDTPASASVSSGTRPAMNRAAFLWWPVYRGPAGSCTWSRYTGLGWRLVGHSTTNKTCRFPWWPSAARGTRAVYRGPAGSVCGLDTPASAGASPGTRPPTERAAFFGGRCIEALAGSCTWSRYTRLGWRLVGHSTTNGTCGFLRWPVYRGRAGSCAWSRYTRLG